MEPVYLSFTELGLGWGVFWALFFSGVFCWTYRRVFSELLDDAVGALEYMLALVAIVVDAMRKGHARYLPSRIAGIIVTVGLTSTVLVASLTGLAVFWWF